MGAVAIEHPISPNESEARGAQEDAGDDDGTEDAKDDIDDKNDGDANDDQYINPNHPPAPDVPTREEWLKHQITHMPYKSWCPICVKNAAVNKPHKLTHHFRGIAQFCMDYMFMTKKPTEE